PFALGAYGSAALTALRSTLPWAAAMPSAGASLDSFRALVEFLRPAIVSSLEQEVDWPATFDRLVASLHWLGLIQRSVGSPPTVRPAQLLEALFGPTTQPARVDSFVVQPNLEIVAPPNLNLVVLRQLLQLAEGPAVAGAIVVRLTLGSLRAALDCGWTGESILAFLSEHSSTPIAQTVRRAIQDVAAQYGAIELGSAEIYLKAATPALMQELLALSSLRQVVRPLTDTVALVAKADEAKVAATLRQAGKLPHVIDDVPRTARRREQYSGPQPARTFEPNWDSLAHSDEPVPQRPKRARSDGPILQRPERAPSNGHQEAAIPIEVDVLLAAIESGQDVEIRYQNAKGAMSTRLIEPYDLDEEHLYAYCHSANQEMTFKLRNIVWARPADAQLCLI
ncbi:MAG: helicase-associated domain-containing protein, partial [Chloroflexota bacterium]|nr:helicase-associated domain-containing protein [Chloroflexota bacterium]